jgi:ribose transport system permease protein
MSRDVLDSLDEKVDPGKGLPLIGHAAYKKRGLSLSSFSVRKIGAVYVWILAIAIFSILKPHEFLALTTFQGIASQYAIVGLGSVAVVVALASGSFDITIGANIGLSSMVFTLVVRHGSTSIIWAVSLAMLVGLSVAIANIITVVVFEIDSFIGTLAMSAIIDAVAVAMSGGQSINARAPGSWSVFATSSIAGIQLPFYYLLIIAIAIGYWLERTRSGRYIYAVGFDRETARLTGLPIRRLRAAGFLTSGLVGAFTGILLAAQVGSATAGSGDSYLIPTFSAAFLGATQVRPGRFNTWGTLISVFLLATGDYGITIVGGPTWSTQMFQGVVLLVAIGLAQLGGNRLVTRGRAKSLAGSWRSRLDVVRTRHQ